MERQHDFPPQISDALAAYFGQPSPDADHPEDCRWQTLADMSKIRQHLEALHADLDSLVRHAHEDHGVSWAEIGRVVGITRQAARQRFARN